MVAKKISEYVTTREAAELLGVSKARVDQFVRAGRLQGILMGNARLLLRADVVAFGRISRPPGPAKKSGK